jgi:hypothetical protein
VATSRLLGLGFTLGFGLCKANQCARQFVHVWWIAADAAHREPTLLSM